ncbi:MAG: PAS domain S-box protein [Coriobacteriales bacterium]|jgi:membrane protease YdiL (CAAX protease family)|nr:PAS domain S-box protein [Coriobacteriales bacterium]
MADIADRDTSRSLNRRILRDMSDGIMVVDMSGHVRFMNAAAEDVLGVGFSQLSGRPFAATFITDERNDAFSQLIVNATCDKDVVHRDRVDYYLPDAAGAGGAAGMGVRSSSRRLPHAAAGAVKAAAKGAATCRSLDLTVSFVYDDGGGKEGIVVLIEDVTDLVRVEREKREGIQIFSYGLGLIVVFLFLWQALSAFMEVPNWLMARIMELLTLSLAVFALTRTSMTVKDIGVIATPRQLRVTLVRGAAIGAAIIALFAVARLVVDQVMPDATASIPFFDWHLDEIAQQTYPVVVPFQELLAKGIVLTALLHIFNGTKRMLPLILGSSLLFAAMHVNYGIAMMTGAFALCFATGWLYLKDRNIWGCAIVHFCLGFFVTCFGFEQLFLM